MTAGMTLQERPTAASPAGPGNQSPDPVTAVQDAKSVKPDFTGNRESDPDRLARGAANLIRRLGRAAAVTDASVLKDLVDLKALIDEVAADAAVKLHAGDAELGLEPLPYEAFAVEFGTTRQNIYARWFKTPRAAS